MHTSGRGTTTSVGEHIPDPRDVGLTHIALPVRNADTSAAFYARFAGLHVAHRRDDGGTTVVWLADGERPFVLVCIEHEDVSPQLAGDYAHIGIGCRDREDLDARLADARIAGHTVIGPHDYGPPVGYWAIVVDPDGHNLELSVGQEIGAALTSR